MQLRFHVAERRELRHAIATELRRTPHRPGKLFCRLAEPIDELVGVAADRRVEDFCRERVGRRQTAT